MKDITIEEAINELKERMQTLKRHIKNYEESKCETNIYNQLKKESKAIEKVLNELNDYKEGKIVSLKLLEKFNLISRDEKNQHSFANEDFFEKYVPKDIIKKKDKIIDAMTEEIEKFGCLNTITSAIDCTDKNDCKDCIKQYFERIVENE